MIYITPKRWDEKDQQGHQSKNHSPEEPSDPLAMKLLLCILSYLAVLASGAVVSYRPSIYNASTQYSVKVNNVYQQTINYAGYDYLQMDLDEGTTYTYIITAIPYTTFENYTISPKKALIKATKSGNQLTFTTTKALYLIVKIQDLKQIVIMADPTETDKPASSGTGIFNVMSYNADNTGNTLTAAVQTALTAAGKSPGSTVYVPAGIYKIGNLIIPTDTSLYLAGGSVLRNSGIPKDYTNDYNKTGLLPGTWWIRTDFKSKNIKIYGRGTIDGNGHTMRVDNKFIAEMVIPVDTTHFIYDGPLIRDSSFWSIVPTQSTDVAIKNSKILNRFEYYEDDGIDVVESTDVRVYRSVAVSRDDCYSTKTWPLKKGTTVPFPNPPMPLKDVVFSDCLAWTQAYGYKIGQGAYEEQSNIVFKDSTAYRVAVGLGIDHKFGTALVSNVTFYNIDVEELWSDAAGKATWLALFVENSDGNGPVSDVKVNSINAYQVGLQGGFIQGFSDTSKVSNVELWNIHINGSTTAAKTLAEMNIKNTAFSENINAHQ